MGASLTTAGIICALGVAAVGLVSVGSAAATSQRAAGIADSAALAAAETLAGFAAGDPCANAATLAAAQAAVVSRCELSGLIATVEISTQFGALPVHAIARAGPPR